MGQLGLLGLCTLFRVGRLCSTCRTHACLGKQAAPLELVKKLLKPCAALVGGCGGSLSCGRHLLDGMWTNVRVAFPTVQPASGYDAVKWHGWQQFLWLVYQNTKSRACWLTTLAAGWRLQVKNARGEWITAAPVPGSFVCNVGDMLRVYSNGAFPPCSPFYHIHSGVRV